MVAQRVKNVLQMLATYKTNQVNVWNNIVGVLYHNYDSLIESIRNYNSVGEIDVFISKEENLEVLLGCKENIVNMIKNSAVITNNIDKYDRATCKGSDIICAPTKLCGTSLVECFMNCTKLLIINRLATNNVTNMGSMFNNCSSLTALDVSGFVTDNVKSMSGMFSGCSSLTALDVSGFVTDNVTSMNDMFYGCSSLTALDVSGFVTDNVTNMNYMFYGCSSLTTLDVSGFVTDNVTSMGGMFYNCSSLTALDVSGFVTDNVTSMSGMFNNCSSLTALDVSGFVTDNVANMNYMFSGCSSLTALDVSGFVTDNVKDMSGMFYNCSSLTALENGTISLKSATSVTLMFWNCYALETISISDVYISGINLGSCSKLSDASVVSWITALYDWSNNPEGKNHSYDFIDTLPSITFHKTTGAKIETLTSIYNIDGVDEELTLLDIALLKGWQINY